MPLLPPLVDGVLLSHAHSFHILVAVNGCQVMIPKPQFPPFPFGNRDTSLVSRDLSLRPCHDLILTKLVYTFLVQYFFFENSPWRFADTFFLYPNISGASQPTSPSSSVPFSFFNRPRIADFLTPFLSLISTLFLFFLFFPPPTNLPVSKCNLMF